MNNLFFIFLNGILFFIGMKNNPIEEYLKNNSRISDADKIRNDWYNVGNDIKKAYDSETGSTSKC